jgi:glycosyltransferase involved in cell wall biosynthesis
MSEPEANAKKVLVITYYWPPSGGSGVQRWLKFVKYLPQFGWTPYVFTPENPSFDLKDESLLRDVPAEAEVLHFPIWEPYSLFSTFAGAKGEKLNSNSAPKGDTFFKKLAIWIRGNFFIPDPRVFWLRPAANFLHDFLIEQKIRTIITTGPPHSVHLIGLRLKKKNPSLNWIADFRDPWSEWGFLDTVKVGSLARWLHKRLERNVLQHASHVTTITPFYVRQFKQLAGRNVKLLTNGFDEDDFTHFAPEPTEKFVIRFVGIVNEMCNPIPFMETVATVCNANAAFREKVHISFVGEVNARFYEFVTRHPTLSSVTAFTKTVPHKELINFYKTSSVLLVVLTGVKGEEGQMPGKLFEYIATGLPVLGVGTEHGDAANLIKQAQCGVMVSEKNTEKVTATLLTEFERWSKGVVQGSQHKELYSRRAITKQLTELLS